jgi:hypothetical protein
MSTILGQFNMTEPEILSGALISFARFAVNKQFDLRARLQAQVDCAWKYHLAELYNLAYRGQRQPHIELAPPTAAATSAAAAAAAAPSALSRTTSEPQAMPTSIDAKSDWKPVKVKPPAASTASVAGPRASAGTHVTGDMPRASRKLSSDEARFRFKTDDGLVLTPAAIDERVCTDRSGRGKARRAAR